MTAPQLTRDPDALPSFLPTGADIPADLDPLAEGVLMAHQKSWLEDTSDLKICEKGRRTGITFAEMLDMTLIAASSRSAGGMNCFYIGDTKDKGREAIGYVAHFAKVIAQELGEVEEFLFEDQDEEGNTRKIAAYRVTFASGYRVEALSSRPANIRGLQGAVCIDEAAFHNDVRNVLDAVNALLIWGGKVRLISTHDGHLNPFNELIREARSGKSDWKVHRYTFADAIANGLYVRVCLMKGEEWTQEKQDAWEKQVRGSYGARTAAMQQELDAIPSEMAGAALTRVQIEACLADGIPFIRWHQPDAFKNAPEPDRRKETEAWCIAHLDPVLKALNPKLRHYFGEDFARNGDATDVVVLEEGEDLVRRARMVVEMRNIPFEQQKQVLFHIVDALPRFSKGALDKTGNGAYLAEVAAQKYGARIVEVSFSRTWYQEQMPPYIAAFADRTILLPKHADILSDHQALQFVDGVIKVPENFRFKGSDGLERHGDTAIAGPLAWYASEQEPCEIDYTPVPTAATEDEDEDTGRGWWRSPLGLRLPGFN
ncbi:hypothetical protein [Sagittula sp. S175]|uniref:hypothetical protein n=1 Tax=Sagittula sp. S175 TaxID=3415129 RepID=UPI003C7DE7FA